VRAPADSVSWSDPRSVPELARRLGLFDATMLVMGGIVGSGIFVNPAVVAQHVHTPALVLGAWVAGGVIAIAGAFIAAELAARRPQVGGQYAYIREAMHPAVAFCYGWGLLLVTQSGGMAAVAVTFARYAATLLGVALPERIVAVGVLLLLSLVNCVGVRAGSTTQSVLMVLKVAAIAGLVVCGALLAPPAAAAATTSAVARDGSGFALLTAFGAALVPVLFAYGGWQTAPFVAGEMREPRRDLPRGLLLGVGGVVVLYLAVSWVCLRVLGPAGLAATHTPAGDVMAAALGAPGRRLLAAAIAISTLGFLSQSMLTSPRVYYAMAEDGLFLRAVAWVHPKTRVPVVAVLLQGLVAAVIAWSGSYEEVLSYVVSVDWVFFGLAASCLFVFRRRDRAAGVDESDILLAPGHPLLTAAFVTVSALVVLNTAWKFPLDSAIGLGILASGLPVYALWRFTRRRVPAAPPGPAAR
jgi:APA family basic amino acid/polyamine antiporter